jgi:hypothetical protein
MKVGINATAGILLVSEFIQFSILRRGNDELSSPVPPSCQNGPLEGNITPKFLAKGMEIFDFSNVKTVYGGGNGNVHAIFL